MGVFGRGWRRLQRRVKRRLKRSQVATLAQLSDGKSVRRDAIAGLTVGVMLVPQAMAYAVLAGLPPEYGLYASLVPLVIYGLVGGSRTVAVGIVALDMLILGDGLQRIAPDGGPELVPLAICAALLVGTLQLAMAALRLGFLVNFLSRPVILGFTTAAPVLIATSQLDTLTGVQLPRTQMLHERLLAFVGELGAMHLPSLAIGLPAIAILLLLRYKAPKAPAALIVVVLTGLATWLLDLPAQGVATLDAYRGGPPTPEFPPATMRRVRALLPTVVTLALVQFMTLVALGRSFAQERGEVISADRELRALGLCNLVGALFRSVPVSASFSRSAINDEAGARTGLANVFAALTVLAAMLVAGPLFNQVPMPALAAIILVSTLGMLQPKAIPMLWKLKREDGWVALLTTLTTLVFGVQEGVLLGVGGAMLLMLARSSRPAIVPLRKTAYERYRPISEGQDPVDASGVMVLRVDGSLSFVNAAHVVEMVGEQLTGDHRVRAVVLDGRSVNDVDATAVGALERLAESLDQQDVQLVFSSFKDHLQDVIRRGGVCEYLDAGCFQPSADAAVQRLRSAVPTEQLDAEELEEVSAAGQDAQPPKK